ncbi:hypothetical protein ACS0TY_027783 [Phlomoides rotata]
MENSLAILLLLLLLSALAFFSKSFIFKHRKNLKLPPGPTPWPIIGNFNLIGPIPHQSLHSLSQKYGDIMQLKLGKFPVVVASSPEMAKQFLRIHDASFASRPTLAAGKYTSYNYSDTALTPYGPFWRQARKIFHSEMLNENRLEASEHIRVDEMHNFMSRLRSLSGKPVVVRDHLFGYTISTISRILFNKKYYSESKNDGDSIVSLHELREMIDGWLLLNSVLNIGDWIPWLSFVDLHGYVKRMKHLNKKFDRFNEHAIDDHLARRARDKDFVQKDMVDVLLQLAEDPNLEVEMTRDNMKGLLQGFLMAGADPSATTVEWTILELLRHPWIIKKAKEELDRVIGRKRWVEEKDLSKLPFINAIVMESLRLHPIGTLLIPHYAIKDCKVATT